MRLAQWITSFRALHEKAKKSELPEPEQRSYLAAREELARALLAAQRVQTKPGQSFRQALRVSRALQANLELGEDSVRALTLDVSVGGFGALLAKKPSASEPVKFTLRLPGGDQLSGKARVAGVVPNAGSVRVSFAFEGLAAADAEKLEVLVFDTVLDQIKLEPEPKK